jgi:hypothetical protein
MDAQILWLQTTTLTPLKTTDHATSALLLEIFADAPIRKPSTSMIGTQALVTVTLRAKMMLIVLFGTM